MKIKCISNKINAIPQDLSDNFSFGSDPLSIKPDKEYIVYAVWIYLGYIWYCITDEQRSYYPMWHPSMLFEVADSRLSRYWIFSLDEDKNKKNPFLSFPEWANNPNFYWELHEGGWNDPNAQIFKKYKNLMDLEFPDPTISDMADIGDKNWLICPKCIDAWEWKDDRDALVKCPKCKTIFNNPRYRNELPHL